MEPQFWAADRTGDGLGVVAAVSGIAVFALTIGTLHEVCHTGVRAIIRQCVDDGIARAAVDAINKRIAVATIRFIKQFALTILTDRDVG